MSAAPDDLADSRLAEQVALGVEALNQLGIPNTLADVIEALQRQLSTSRAERERMRPVVEAAARYIHCCSSPELSPYIRENGKYGTMSPWRELCEAVKAAALSPRAAETPKEPGT